MTAPNWTDKEIEILLNEDNNNTIPKKPITNIHQYFNLIYNKIHNKDFKILEIKSNPPKEISVFIEAINYIMWEWDDDHKDIRTNIFDYIIVPNNVDFDFTSITFEDLITFLSKTKSKKIDMVNI